MTQLSDYAIVLTVNVLRAFRDFVKDSFLRKLWELGQLFNLDILPHHFYSSIPTIRELRREEFWRKPCSMFGINGISIMDQLHFVEECCNNEFLQMRMKKNDIYRSAFLQNGESGFRTTDANFLYCFMYTKRPKRIVQIGAGLSTAVMLLASADAHYRPEIVCIDPYPNKFIKQAASDGKIVLVAGKTQKVSWDLMTNLGDDGLLFIDSTHTVKCGSEVNMLVLEVLPRVPRGNFVHFHDIYFPYDYQRGILENELFFSNESTLVHAFLINNTHYTIKASLSMLHYEGREGLKKFLPNYNPAAGEYGLLVPKEEFPSSLYLRSV